VALVKLDLVSLDCRLWCKRSFSVVLLVGLLAFAMFFFFGSASAAPLFPTPVELVPGGQQPRVAIAANGEVAAVWMHGFFTAPGCCSNFHDEVVGASGSALRGMWEAPEVISIPGYSILPEVAAGAQGDAAAVWLDSYPGKNTIDASYRPASSGVWQPPVTVSAAGENGTDQHVLVEPDGDALAWWAELGEGEGAGIVAYKTALRPVATGVWGPPREFAVGRHPGGLRLAVDARGDVFAAWVSGGALEAAMLPLGSASWDAPVTVAPAPAPPVTVERVQLAVSPDGNAAALWQQVDKQCPLTTFAGQSRTAACVLPVTLQSSVRSAVTGAWSAPEEIPNAPRAEVQVRAKIAAPAVLPLGDQDPQIAVDSAGDAVATWAQFEATKAGLEVSVRPASTHAWRTPTMLSPTGGDFAAGARYLAVDDVGRALVTWDAGGVIQGSVGSATTGRWQEPVDVTPEDSGAGEPHVAVNEAGDAVLLWSGYRAMDAITFNLSNGVPGYRPPKPAITKASMSNSRFRVRGPTTSGLPPIGTRIRFRLFPEASVKVTIEQLTPGRRHGSTCLASRDTSPRARRRACYLRSLITTLERREKAGSDSIPFAGAFPIPLPIIYGDNGQNGSTAKRVSRTRYLKPGLYVAVLTATNTTGTSVPVRLRFTVVR
jgi:hypothetical protein